VKRLVFSIALRIFRGAIDELLSSSGFHRAELSLVASERTVKGKLGHRHERSTSWPTIRMYRERPMCQPRPSGGAEGTLIGALAYFGATAANF
jgi:hypothetical protein